MKIILFQWPDSEPHFVEALKRLEQRGHEIVYWVYSWGDGENLKTIFPKVILHNHVDAQNGFPPKDHSDLVYPPADRELIEKVYKVESVTLSMMNKRYDYLCVDERKHLYYRMLAFWHGVLKQYSPDLVLFANAPPHAIYDYVAYELAKLLKIRTLVFDATLVTDKSLLMNDFRVGSSKLIKSITTNKQKKVTMDDLGVETRKYYEMQTKERDSTPWYLKEERKRYSLFNSALRKLKIVWNSLQDRTLLTKAVLFVRKFFWANIKKNYRRYQSEPDFGKPFVYFPLNYQPECTTSPQGDIFVDLLLAVEMVSAALPVNWSIFVKEHPAQWFTKGLNFSSSRYESYYRQLAAIPNVVLVPIETDSYELIERSKAVLTVTGTAALEAALRLKPSAVFGYPWFQNCPFIKKIDSVAKCHEFFRLLNRGYEISSEEVLRFMKNLDDGTINCYFAPTLARFSKLTPEQNAQNAIEAVIEAIDNEQAN